MKISIWDILTGLTLLGVLCLLVGFGAILLNPATPLNPFRAEEPALVTPIVIPTATATEIGLPPTWTPAAPTQQPTAPSGGQTTNVLPTLRPSRTPEPTATRVVLPTFTPSKTVRVGAGGSGSGGQGGGACDVIYQNPQDDTVLPAGSAFDMRWTLKNTSGSSWRSDSVDVKFISGDRLHTGADIRDLPYEVGAGSAVDIVISMSAPSGRGTYTTNWALSAGNTAVCRFFVTIKTP